HLVSLALEMIMGVGHHWVPRSVRDALAKMLSSDAIDVFTNAVTGDPHNVWHDGSTENGVTHPMYNQLIREKLERRIAELKQRGLLVKGKMTADQARDFVKQIKKNGLGDRRIADFNRGVIKTLRLPVLGG